MDRRPAAPVPPMVSETSAEAPDVAGERFPPARRLHSRREFLEAYDRGRRFRGRFVILFACPAEGSGARIGITVTRKVGPAALRNRLRRRVREIFRRSPAARSAASCRLVVNVSPRAAGASFSELQTEIETLLKNAGRSLP